MAALPVAGTASPSVPRAEALRKVASPGMAISNRSSPPSGRMIGSVTPWGSIRSRMIWMVSLRIWTRLSPWV